MQVGAHKSETETQNWPSSGRPNVKARIMGSSRLLWVFGALGFWSLESVSLTICAPLRSKCRQREVYNVDVGRYANSTLRVLRSQWALKEIVARIKMGFLPAEHLVPSMRL